MNERTRWLRGHSGMGWSVSKRFAAEPLMQESRFMAGTMELLGALLKRGMTDSSATRIEHSLSEKGIGGAGGILEQLGRAPAREPAAAQAGKRGESESGSPLDSLGGLGELAKSFLGEGTQGKSRAGGGLGALVGAILGGGGKSAKGAIGGGAL